MSTYFFAARIDLTGRTVYSDGLKKTGVILDLDELRREIAQRASASTGFAVEANQVALTCISRLTS